jgi:hypothetical protein
MRTTLRTFALLLTFVQISFAQTSLGVDSNKINVAGLPDAYPFTWKYIMEISADNGTAIPAEYYIEPGAEYFGMNMSKANDMFIVMDNKNKVILTAFTKGKERVGTVTKMPDYAAMVSSENAKNKFTYKPLPAKPILGYKCKGVEATNDDYVMTFYYTNDVGVSFAEMIKSKQNKIPDAFKDYFKPGDKPLMMSVDFTDRKTGKTTMMKCVGLENSPYVFSKSDYKFM